MFTRLKEYKQMNNTYALTHQVVLLHLCAGLKGNSRELIP